MHPAISHPASLVPELVDERIPVNVRKLIDLARAISAIETKEQRRKVGELHAQLGSERRATEEQKENDQQLKAAAKKLEELRAPYTITIDTLKAWEGFIKGKMSAYDTAELQKVREQQQKAIVNTGKKNDTIIEKSGAIGVKPILKATPILEAPAKIVKTEDGQSSSRKVVYSFRFEGVGPDEDLKKLIGSDPRLDKLSREYFLVNISAITKDVKEPRHHARLKAMGLIIEESFDYTSRG